MSTKTKTKISDLYSPFYNPAGSLLTGVKTPVAPAQAPSVDRSKLTVGGNQNLSSMFSLPNVSPAFKNAMSGYTLNADGQLVKKETPAPMGPVAPAAPVTPQGAGVARGTSPVAPNPTVPPTVPGAPTMPEAPAQADVPPNWKNPDGSIKPAEQIAQEIAAALKTSASGPDVGRLAGNQFGGAEKTAEQLMTEAALINNARNDIAVGENDPYKIASESGIAYTPEQLRAIESSYAGIYDPALTGAFSKLETKQTEDEAKRKEEADTKASERDFKNDLQKLAVVHDYDLENMSKSHEYDVILQTMKEAAKAGAGGAGAMTPYSDERSQRTIQSVDELIPQVDANPGIFGRSAAAPIPDFLRSQDFLDFQTELNTLKASVAFNELTAMREASKTGGALGNVSNIELGLLESALGGLNMSQSPENFKEQLNKVKGSINRWRTAQGAAAINSSGAGGGGGAIPSGTDGSSYGYPGYVSDGTQWVLQE